MAISKVFLNFIYLYLVSPIILFVHLTISSEINTDNEVLVSELVNLLNIGKKLMGLKTESAQEFMEVIAKKNEIKTPQMKLNDSLILHISKFDSNKLDINVQPDEEKYLVLSGNDAKIHIEKQNNVKILHTENSNEINDIFEMVLDRFEPSINGSEMIKERLKIIERDHYIPSMSNKKEDVLNMHGRMRRNVFYPNKENDTISAKNVTFLRSNLHNIFVMPLVWSAIILFTFILIMTILIVRTIRAWKVNLSDNEDNVNDTELNDESMTPITSDSEKTDFEWEDIPQNYLTNTSMTPSLHNTNKIYYPCEDKKKVKNYTLNSESIIQMKNDYVDIDLEWQDVTGSWLKNSSVL